MDCKNAYLSTIPVMVPRAEPYCNSCCIVFCPKALNYFNKALSWYADDESAVLNRAITKVHHHVNSDQHQISPCNIIHLMYGPEGNSFVFPRVLMFPETKSRETSGLKLKQN